MSTQAPRKGTGAFQWNAGGWFGAQVGSTLWLLILGIVFLARGEIAAGLAPLCGFFVANAVGFHLWTSRARVAPFIAIQALVAVMGVSTLAALLLLDHLGSLAAVDPRFSEHPRRLYWLLALYPALMVLFLVQERTIRRVEPVS